MTSPRGTLRCSAISLLSCSLPRPAKSISFFLVTTSIAAASPVTAARPARHRTRGNVPGDHGAGARVRLVADLDRRDEDGVGRDPSVLPDLGPVLLPPVVVGGDRPRADVGAVADLGVADVREVWNLRPLTDLRVLDLDERADVGAGSEAGA